MEKKKKSLPHLRLGATSFLLHADYVPAVRFAAEYCDDVALLLVETGMHGEFLPDAEAVREMRRILDGEGATLHVHLPTDSDFDTPRRARRLVEHVRRAVDCAAPLDPHSFVLHVDFPTLHGTGNAPGAEQQAWTAEALGDIAALLPAPEQLAIENLEDFSPHFWDGWLVGTPFSRCLDIGHIWKDGGDPAPLLADWLESVRVIHLHGLEPRRQETATGRERNVRREAGWGEGCEENRRFGLRPRDHVSLRLMPPELVDAVMHPLWTAGFAGVLNLEVFSFEDFTESHAVLLRAWERFREGEE